MSSDAVFWILTSAWLLLILAQVVAFTICITQDDE